MLVVYHTQGDMQTRFEFYFAAWIRSFWSDHGTVRLCLIHSLLSRITDPGRAGESKDQWRETALGSERGGCRGWFTIQTLGICS